MFFRLSFVTLILAVVVLGTPVKRDAVQVENDIKILHEKSKVLATSIDEFNGTLEQITAIHEAAMDLDNALQSATSDATNSNDFTDEQANAIIGLVNAFVPGVQEVLNDLVVKKAEIVKLSAGPIAESDLTKLNKDADAFGGAIFTKTPADQQGDVQQERDTINRAFSAAIAAFST